MSVAHVVSEGQSTVTYTDSDVRVSVVGRREVARRTPHTERRVAICKLICTKIAPQVNAISHSLIKIASADPAVPSPLFKRLLCGRGDGQPCLAPSLTLASSGAVDAGLWALQLRQAPE